MPLGVSRNVVTGVVVVAIAAAAWWLIPGVTSTTVDVKVPDLSPIAEAGQKAFAANCAQCHGIAETTDIHIDAVEMADVSWFSRKTAKAAIEQSNPDLRVPGAMAIAHHLIRSWVYGEVEI